MLGIPERLRRVADTLADKSSKGAPFTLDVRFCADDEPGVRRAADLLEALSNPPETVEELRERLQKVTGLDDEHTSVTAGELPGNITVAWSEDCEFHEVQISAPTLRAAWFAIVGMMEVGR